MTMHPDELAAVKRSAESTESALVTVPRALLGRMHDAIVAAENRAKLDAGVAAVQSALLGPGAAA